MRRAGAGLGVLGGLRRPSGRRLRSTRGSARGGRGWGGGAQAGRASSSPRCPPPPGSLRSRPRPMWAGPRAVSTGRLAGSFPLCEALAPRLPSDRPRCAARATSAITTAATPQLGAGALSSRPFPFSAGSKGLPVVVEASGALSSGSSVGDTLVWAAPPPRLRPCRGVGGARRVPRLGGWGALREACSLGTSPRPGLGVKSELDSQVAEP